MAGPFVIKTQRLELIAGNLEMAEAELSNIFRLSSLLKAEFPFGWPPPENDENTMEWFFQRIFDMPEARGWLMWYFVATENDKRIVIGNGGFLGLPNENGLVECGYAILEPAQNNGYATEALHGLIKWAFANNVVKGIIAKTIKNNPASNRVLEKNQFKFIEYDAVLDELVYKLKKPVELFHPAKA